VPCRLATDYRGLTGAGFHALLFARHLSRISCRSHSSRERSGPEQSGSGQRRTVDVSLPPAACRQREPSGKAGPRQHSLRKTGGSGIPTRVIAGVMARRCQVFLSECRRRLGQLGRLVAIARGQEQRGREQSGQGSASKGSGLARNSTAAASVVRHTRRCRPATCRQREPGAGRATRRARSSTNSGKLGAPAS